MELQIIMASLSRVNMRMVWISVSIASLFVWGTILWDYTHDGVPTHYMLQSDSLPGFSNWLGAITIPVFTWWLMCRIAKRVGQRTLWSEAQSELVGLITGILFSICLSYFFTIGSDLPGYLTLAVFALSLFIPIYLSHYMLGYVLGLVYTFGGVLPILFSAIIATIGWLIYNGLRPALLYIFRGVVK